MSEDVLDLTVAEAAAEISGGALSPEEYFDAWQTAASGDELNAYLSQVEDDGYQVEDGPLRGIPVAVKDIFCTEGTVTTAGSRIPRAAPRPDRRRPGSYNAAL